MGDPKVKKPSSSPSPSRGARTKHLEKIAVKPNLPVENLLDEFIRQSLAPDANDGNNYFIGHVVGKITSKNDIQMYDIFTDSVSNLERFHASRNKRESKDIQQKLIVHIPELYSLGDVPTAPDKDILHYVTKFRVDYSGPNEVKIGDLVKIVFKNSKLFTDPEVVSVHEYHNTIVTIDDKSSGLKDKLNAYLECRVDQLSGSNGAATNLNSTFYDLPKAGYYQLFDELSLQLSNVGYGNFSDSLGEVDKKAFVESLKPIKYRIFCDNLVKPIAEKKENLKQNLVANLLTEADGITANQLDYEVYVKVFVDNLNENQEILTKYVSYLESCIKDKYSFVVDDGGIIQKKNSSEGSFYIKIDVNLSSSDASVEESASSYVSKSEKLKSGPIPSQSEQDIPIAQLIGATIVEQNGTPETCENPIAAINDYYINIKNISKFKRKNDIPYINLAFNPTSLGKPADFNYAETVINKDIGIVGELLKTKKPNPYYTFKELKNKNPNFYSIPPKVVEKIKQKKIPEDVSINSNFDDDSKNFITEDALNSRLGLLSTFLNSLRKRIAANEFSEQNIPIEEKIKKIFIFPINTIRAKSKNDPYKFSRHYFGQAIDFIVYLKDGDDVFQIPPEVVYLYCKKANNGSKELIGNGIFFDDMYNHFEFVNLNNGEENPASFINTKGLNEDEKQNGRLWLSGNLPDGLKNVKDSTVEKLHKEIVNYVSKASAGNQKISRILT
jgi:hypothetical protein